MSKSETYEDLCNQREAIIYEIDKYKHDIKLPSQIFYIGNPNYHYVDDLYILFNMVNNDIQKKSKDIRKQAYNFVLKFLPEELVYYIMSFDSEDYIL